MLKNRFLKNLPIAIPGLLLVFALSRTALAQQDKLPANDRDYLGYYRQSHQYAKIAKQGIVVVNLPEEESFFAYWVPPSGSVEYAMILLHGTGGTAYDELGDEMEMALRYGYAIIGIQWLDKRSGRYFEARKVNRIMDKALRHLGKRFGRMPDKAALCGFSRGSAVSYEVAYYDRLSDQRLSLVIAHSGGIPTDNVVAPGENSGPGAFYEDLTSGKLGEPYAGLRFFLYAGCRDEEWGTTMCEYMRYTKEVLEKTGASVPVCIIDPNGAHAGYRRNSAYHEQAVKLFLSDRE